MKLALLTSLVLIAGCTPFSNTKEDVTIQTEYYKAAVEMAKFKRPSEPTLVIECPENNCKFDRITYNSPVAKDNSPTLDRAKTSAEVSSQVVSDAVAPIASVLKIGLGAAGIVMLNKSTAESAGSGNTSSHITTVGNENSNTATNSNTPTHTVKTGDDNNSVVNDDDNSVVNNDDNSIVNNDDNSVVNNDDNSVTNPVEQ